MSKRKSKDQSCPLEALDAAVMSRFPGVHCETTLSLWSMSFVTRWRKAGTDDEDLKPSQAKLVREYVAGFMAGYEHLTQGPRT